MKILVRSLLPLLVFLLMSIYSITTKASSYEYKSIDYGENTATIGINDFGEIVGWNTTTGFLYRNMEFIPINYPITGSQTNPYSINNNGLIVGSIDDATGRHGFIYDEDVFSVMDHPERKDTSFGGINDGSKIVGYTVGNISGYTGIIYDGSDYTDVVPPNGHTHVQGINNYGDMVMWAAGGVSYVFDGANYTRIEHPNCPITFAYGINDAGLIVGDYRDDKGIHGFLFDGNDFMTIDYPGAINTWAYGINNHGQIVGNYIDIKGDRHGFLANPVPVPKPFAYITNYGDDTVSVIDTATNTVTATIPVGHCPFGVAVLPDGSAVYVTNSGVGTVSVIDTTTNTVTDTIPMESDVIWGIAASPDGSKVYVSVVGDRVSVIDTATNTVTDTIYGKFLPVGIAVHPDGSKVYVNNFADVDAVIDTNTNTVTATIPLYAWSIGIAVHPDGSKFMCQTRQLTITFPLLQ